MNKRMSVDSKIHFRKPCIAGTRITFENVLELINERLSFEEMTMDYYPGLETEEIKAWLDY